MSDLTKAITSLYPTALWQLNGDDYSGLVWMSQDIQKPTKLQLETEALRIQAEYEANEYQRQRAKEYPNLGDQLDMLWHAIDAGTLNKTSAFYKTLKAVKDEYPKAE
jgi:hypothetical protein